jgi:hypothetical protein
MSNLLDEPTTRPTTSPAQRLRTTMAAVRVSFVWFGTRKTLTAEQKAQAADTLGAELDEAVWRLDEHYAEMRSAARDRLRSLFNPADYPESLRGLFGVSGDFPSVEPPACLLQLNRALYEQERERAMSRFEQPVQLAEEAFTSELAKLVSHLTGQDDGKPKVFRDSAVDDLVEFFFHGVAPFRGLLWFFGWPAWRLDGCGPAVATISAPRDSAHHPIFFEMAFRSTELEDRGLEPLTFWLPARRSPN